MDKPGICLSDLLDRSIPNSIQICKVFFPCKCARTFFVPDYNKQTDELIIFINCLGSFVETFKLKKNPSENRKQRKLKRKTFLLFIIHCIESMALQNFNRFKNTNLGLKASAQIARINKNSRKNFGNRVQKFNKPSLHFFVFIDNNTIETFFMIYFFFKKSTNTKSITYFTLLLFSLQILK